MPIFIFTFLFTFKIELNIVSAQRFSFSVSLCLTLSFSLSLSCRMSHNSNNLLSKVQSFAFTPVVISSLFYQFSFLIFSRNMNFNSFATAFPILLSLVLNSSKTLNMIYKKNFNILISNFY